MLHLPRGGSPLARCFVDGTRTKGGDRPHRTGSLEVTRLLARGGPSRGRSSETGSLELRSGEGGAEWDRAGTLTGHPPDNPVDDRHGGLVAKAASAS